MTSPTVLYGPSFSTLRRRAFSRAAADAGSRPGSVLLFEANDAQRGAHVDAWSAAPDRNALQLDTDGLASFVSKAHDRLVDPVPDVATLERQRTIEQALEELETIEDASRYASAFSELFRELEAHGALTPEAVTDRLASSDLDPAIVEEIDTAFERYCELRGELAHPEARVRSRKYLAVAEAAGSLAEAFPAVDHVIVSGHVDPSPVEMAVLERVAEEFPTTIVLPALHGGGAGSTGRNGPEPAGTDLVLSSTLEAYERMDPTFEYVPPTDDAPTRDVAERLYTPAATTEPVDATDSISWREAPTPDREVRHLARQLRERLATTDAAPEDVLVLAPGLLSYRERIDDVFAEYGVPYVASVSILLERTYAGRAMLDALALCADPDAEQLVRLATNPVATLEGIDSAELASLVRRLPSSDVESLRGRADGTLRESLDELLDRAAAVRTTDGDETLAAFGGLLDSLAVRSNVEAFEIDAGDADVGDDSFAKTHPTETVRADAGEVAIGYEERAVRRVRRILESLIPVLDRGVEDPVAEIERALQGVRIPAPKRSAEGRVRLVGLEDTPMVECSHLYVLGATREYLPRDPDRPRYFQRVGDALELLPADRGRHLARYRFGLLLANADTVHFTTPAESMGGEEVLASPMLDELRSVASIDRSEGVEGERRGSREDVQRALAGAGPERLVGPLEAARAEGVFSSAQVAAVRDGATTCADRASAAPTSHGGLLGPETLPQVGDDLVRTPFSPSRLNTYAKCGFRYYLSKGLELSEPDEFSPDAGRFAVGDVVHQALEFFYEDLLADCDGPVDLDGYDRAELERRLLAAGTRAREAVDEDFESPFDRHQLRTIFAGLGEPAGNEFYGAGDVTGLLVRVLNRELRDDGGRPLLVESWFGGDDVPVTLEDGAAVAVHGVIDRVDLTETEDGSTGVRVVDYKTYNRDATDAVRGFDFQLPAYLLGARHLVESELGETPAAVDGEYRVFSPPRTVRHPSSLGQRVERDLDADLEDFLSEVVPERIERAIDGIESGAFQPAVVGADEAGCRNCDYAAVCDVRHHRRFEAIDAIDENGHPAYVPAAARPGDLTDHVPIEPAGGDDC